MCKINIQCAPNDFKCAAELKHAIRVLFDDVFWEGTHETEYDIVLQVAGYGCSFGDLKEQSLKDILNNSLNRKKLLKIKCRDVKCSKNCKYKKTCVFCPGQALLEKNDLVSKYEEACLVAKIVSDLRKGKEGLL